LSHRQGVTVASSSAPPLVLRAHRELVERDERARGHADHAADLAQRECCRRPTVRRAPALHAGVSQERGQGLHRHGEDADAKNQQREARKDDERSDVEPCGHRQERTSDGGAHQEHLTTSSTGKRRPRPILREPA